MNASTKYSMARDQKNDVPAILFYALVGNDVCNGHWGGDYMTTPEEFEQNVLDTLKFLEIVLPKGSYVFFIGLEEGHVIWDSMYQKMHPLQITYERLWDFVGCLGINSCWGWLNSDPYWRNFTNARAEQLNQVFNKIVKEHKYINFEIAYLGSLLEPVRDRWVKQGGDPSLLFGEVDGGHPSQIAHELSAQIVWEIIESKYPNAIGNINPYNDEIKKRFGDQGGY